MPRVPLLSPLFPLCQWLGRGGEKDLGHAANTAFAGVDSPGAVVADCCQEPIFLGVAEEAHVVKTA